MSGVYITVGGTVVGAFSSLTSPAALRCLRAIGLGCKPQIKKCPQPGEWKRAQSTQRKKRSAAAKTNQVGNYERYPRYLKPGEWKL